MITTFPWGRSPWLIMVKLFRYCLHIGPARRGPELDLDCVNRYYYGMNGIEASSIKVVLMDCSCQRFVT